MKHRSRAVQRSVAAAACILFLLPASLVIAAPSPVVMEARALVGGRFDTAGWAAIDVTLSNDAEPVSGYVAAAGTDGEVRRVVELPAGARKQVTLYLRPQPFARQVDVSLRTADGTEVVSAAAPVKVLDTTGADVAVVGDGAGSLRPQLAGRGTGLPDPIDLNPTDIPDRPEPLAGIEAIIWAGDSSALSDAQTRSIERWVADGGQLIVVGGPDWQARTAAFTSLLPVQQLSATDGVNVESLADWLGSTAAPAGPLTAASGTLKTGAIALDDAPRPLLSSTTSGAGRVIYLAVDLATPAFRGWDATSTLWSRLLPDDRVAQQIDGQFGGFENDRSGQMLQALAFIPSLRVPPAELLLVVILGYIVLIGPVSYLVLRRMDRRELAWVTAPALVIVFSFGSYGIGSAMKGSEVIINRISLARTTTDASAASVSTYAGIFSPGRDSYDLTIEADALVSSLDSSAFFDGNGRPARPADLVGEQGDPAHLRGLSVGVFGLQAIRADAVVAYQPALSVEWHLAGAGIAGTVTNTSQETIDDVAILEASAGRLIGTLKPGDSKDFSLSSSNPDGQASEQIYGFTNFGNPEMTERDMQIYARRMVIDMLVGAGKPLPLGLTASSDDGPFVIGWHDKAAAVGVTVDGHQVRTYDQRVEVIGGRPTIGPGEVRLGASQLSTSVLSTSGDAQRQDFGSVVVGNGGEVHFGISLPLEASRLVPSKLTLQVGTDPMSVVLEQGQIGGQTPPGYQLSVLDPRTDEWMTLGDLSQQGRFDVPDPALLLGNRHSLEVRISASGVDQTFGSVPLFVSATLEGSL